MAEAEKKIALPLRILRLLLPWKEDSFRDAAGKLLLIAAVGAVIYTGGMSATERIAVERNQQQIIAAVEIFAEPPTETETAALPEGYGSQYASLYAVNADIAGWLTVEGTSIDLPVMQAEDNDYYLEHNLYGEDDPYGLPYIDYRVPLGKDYWAKNTLVYGHNMNAGYIFHDLEGYKDAAFYKENPFLTFDTVYNQSRWVIFAAYEANTNYRKGEVFEYFNYVISEDPERAQWYIDECTARSFFTNPIDVDVTDTFLTLQTCMNNAADTKLCIVARRLRADETEADFDFPLSVNNTARVRPRLY